MIIYNLLADKAIWLEIPNILVAIIICKINYPFSLSWLNWQLVYNFDKKL